MTKQEAIFILTEFNAWRRGADMPQPNPEIIGKAIDYAIKYLENESKIIEKSKKEV